ncbi:EAL domain-containing protein [Spongiibacter sp. KMU-158]|uniref:EAL domain-containing protein n=1 Tax=Spongiibacter pelagi TaxID=2760804 RepID=A0A927GXL5_9GAMM|nr:EAL domain-containing protein [Spongiibacter pelagi]MBD2860132.1 EAL domain-containing protein [Spongiibacter pelagi]
MFSLSLRHSIPAVIIAMTLGFALGNYVLEQGNFTASSKFWLIIALGSVLALIGAFFIHYAIILPLLTLGNSIRAWQQDFDKPPKPVTGAKEIRLLSTQFSDITNEIAEQHQRLKIFFDRQLQMVVLYSPDGDLIECNTLVQQFCGMSNEQLRGFKAWNGPWLPAVSNAGEVFKFDFETAVRTKATISHEAIVKNHNNQLRHIRYALVPILDKDEKVKFVLSEVQDDTELQEKEGQRLRLLSFYTMLMELHSAMVRDTSISELYDDICKIIISHGEFVATYIAHIDFESKDVRPVTGNGSKWQTLQHVRFSIDPDIPEGRGPTGLSLRSGKPYVCNDTQTDDSTKDFRTNLKKLGIGSMAVLPLYENKQVIGSLALYSEQSHAFAPDLVKLLETLANDLSYAREIRIKNQQLSLSAEVINNAQDSLMILDLSWKVLSANLAFYQSSGYTSQEVLGVDFFSLGKIPGTDKAFEELKDIINSKGSWQGETTVMRKSGETYPAQIKLSGVKDINGQLSHIIYTATDISKAKQAKEEADFLTLFDPLTGLANRNQLRNTFVEKISQHDASKSQLAIMVLDVDHFKNINDSLGHAAGDEVIKTIAQRLKGLMRPNDVLARIGGDEFALCLENADADILSLLAQQYLWAFDKAINVNGHSVVLRASIGVAIAHQDGENFEDLFRNADAAMYQAKLMGRNRFHFFTEELNQSAKEKLFIETALHNAIENGELKLFYQAKVALCNKRIVGMEALMRWNNPQLGQISPDKFISIAEQSDLIDSIGEWALIEACRQHKEWQALGHGCIPISVNVSARQFSSELVSKIKNALQCSALPPSALSIEITETVLAINAEQTLDILNELSELGIKIYVDDFGTGYSNLAYLKRFPLDGLKLDRAFVNDLETDPEDRAIASSVINLGHALNLPVIAEGVENQRQVDILIEMGCDEVQGFFYSKPLAGHEVISNLKAQDLLI